MSNMRYQMLYEVVYLKKEILPINTETLLCVQILVYNVLSTQGRGLVFFFTIIIKASSIPYGK